MEAYKKIANILRTDKDGIQLLENRLSFATGKKNIIDKIIDENEEIIKNRLDFLGLERGVSSKEVYKALISKVESDNYKFFNALGSPNFKDSNDCKFILEKAQKIANKPKGFFLKKEKARELLIKEPPLKIIRLLGYQNINDLLRKEDIFEIFSALRFIEGNEWLNEVFFKHYESLTPSDFEEREITIKALDPRWALAAHSFVKKKYHNISHLKELGVIFMIPVILDISGELMRNFSLILHYFNEVSFYTDIIRKIADNEKDFSKNLISLLRGDVLDERLPTSERGRYLVIQRYLAKDDENDWRLFDPHINSETIHWTKAEEMLVKAGETFDHFGIDLAFWRNVDWVGDYFKTEINIDVLVSFNLVDTAMSLVMEKEKELVKYLYHHQEALWNKIFIEYFGEEKVESIAKNNLLRGYFEL